MNSLFDNTSSKSLQQIQEEWKDCRRCYFWQIRTQVVPFSGSAVPTLVVIGQAPGEEEDKNGVLFSGPTGRLVREYLENTSQISGDQTLFANVLACWCQSSIRAQFVRNCHELLDQILGATRTRIVLALGQVALRRLGKKEGLETARGIPFHYVDTATGRTTLVLPTYHPAALFKEQAPEKKQQIEEALDQDFKKLGRIYRLALLDERRE